MITLSDLSSQLLVQVTTVYSAETSVAEGNVSRSRQQNISLYSDLPIAGADLTYERKQGGFTASATLSAELNVPIYEKMLSGLEKEIEASLKLAESATGASALNILEKTHAKADMYEKVHLVASLLGSGYVKNTNISSLAVSDKISALQKSASSIEEAAAFLSRGITQRMVYVYPPSVNGNQEITPFAAAVGSALGTALSSLTEPALAEYIFRGDYIISENRLNLSYKLISRADGSTVHAKTVRMSLGASAGLDYRPKTADFDALLYNGLAVSKDFRAELSTGRGRKNLLFRKGEELEILVKLSAPGYVYIVGHTVKPAEKYSYLLEFQDVRGPRRFIRFINADDANKWVSLGEFTVTEPFGTESLQLVASVKDPADTLPAFKHDAATGLYIVDKNPGAAVTKTRAVINSSMKKQANAVFESVLSFTTMK